MADVGFSWLTGPALRAARILSGLSAKEVATLSGLGEATIKRAEACPGQTRLTLVNAKALLATYSKRGITLSGIEPDRSFVIQVRSLTGRAAR